MRVCLIAALAALLISAAPSAAAPTSMLQTLPQTQGVQGQSGPGRMAWLSKWFRKDRPTEAASSVTTPPIAAYQAPPSAAQEPVQQLGAEARAVASQSVPSLPPATSATECKQLRRRGHDHDRAGDLIAAEALYRRAISADPTSAAALNDLGLCLARQGKLDASAAVLRQAIAMRPDKPLYRNNIATVLVEQGLPEEALVNLKAVYGPSPAHYNLGQLLSRAGRPVEAIEQMRVSAQIDPAFKPARDALASLQGGAPGSEPLAAAEVIDVPPPPAGAVPGVVAPLVQRVAAVTPSVVSAGEPDEPAGVPSFPRLLPPVLDR